MPGSAVVNQTALFLTIWKPSLLAPIKCFFRLLRNSGKKSTASQTGVSRVSLLLGKDLPQVTIRLYARFAIATQHQRLIRSCHSHTFGCSHSCTLRTDRPKLSVRNVILDGDRRSDGRYFGVSASPCAEGTTPVRRCLGRFMGLPHKIWTNSRIARIECRFSKPTGCANSRISLDPGVAGIIRPDAGTESNRQLRQRCPHILLWTTPLACHTAQITSSSASLMPAKSSNV